MEELKKVAKRGKINIVVCRKRFFIENKDIFILFAKGQINLFSLKEEPPTHYAHYAVFDGKNLSYHKDGGCRGVHYTNHKEFAKKLEENFKVI